MSWRNIFVILCALNMCHGNLFLPDEISWEGGSMAFPSNNVRRTFAQSGKYIAKNVIATKAVIKHDKLVLLTSRVKRGVPASLVLYDRFRVGDSKFTPYPNMAFHEEGNCKAIQNAVDMYLDQKGLLWILDTGIVETMEAPRQVCDPKVICISLKTGSIDRTISLSGLNITNSSRLQHIVVRYENFRNPFVFISDAPNRAILVYDVRNSQGFKMMLPTTVTPKIDPQDVLYFALIQVPLSDPVLYINYLSSPDIFAIKTSFPRPGKFQGIVRAAGKAKEPVIFLGTNSLNRIFFRYNNKSEVYSWDTNKPFGDTAITSIYKSDDCFFPTSVFQDSCTCFKVLQSNFKDFLDGRVGCGVVHKITTLTANNDVPRL